MNGWQKAAWVSSWIAPTAGILTLVILALALASERQGTFLAHLRAPLQVRFFICGVVYLVAHTIVLYRVRKGVGLKSSESSKLVADLQLFGFGYSEWRKTIRNHEKQGGRF